jgi:hypothetical protein
MLKATLTTLTLLTFTTTASSSFAYSVLPENLKPQAQYSLGADTQVRNLAATCPNAVDLKVGDTVTDCPRVGLSLPYNKTVEKELIDNDYNTQIIQDQAKELTLKDLDVQYYKQRGDTAISDLAVTQADLDTERKKSHTDLWVGIAAGILLTSLAVWGASQLSQH